jgi:hypothetical protein
VEECTDVYEVVEINVYYNYVAFSSSLTHGRDLSQFWVVDSACSINLISFRSDFVSLDPPSSSSRVGDVGVDVMESGKVQIAIPLVPSEAVNHTIHASYTHDPSSRPAQRIGRLLSVGWMQLHSGCEFIPPLDSEVGMLLVPT